MKGKVVLNGTLTKLAELPAEEKLAMVRAALYSEDHLFKILFRIAVIVDPKQTEASLEWIRERLSSSIRAEEP